MAAATELVLYPFADFKAIVGDPFFCIAEALDAGGNISTDAVSWTSSNPAVCTIGATTGKFTPLTNGTTTITATAGSITATRTMTVVTAQIGVPIESAVTRAFWQARIAALSSSGPVKSVDALYAGNLQNAYDAAVAADAGWTLTLTPGTEYGNFVLRGKPANLITITTSGSVPPRGTRVTAAVAASYNLPRIWTRNTNAAVSSDPTVRVSNVRFIGVDIGLATGATNKLANLGAFYLAAPARLSLFPQNITCDRVFFRGRANAYDSRFGFDATGVWIAAIDCDATEHHYDANVPGGYGTDTNYDSQGMRSIYGPGPIYAENCGWEASHEPVTLGGGDASAVGVGTVSASAGTLTFSSSQAGIVSVGTVILVNDVRYVVRTFNGTTSATTDGTPTFGASSFMIGAFTNMLLRDVRLYRCKISRPMAWKGVYSAKNLFEIKQGLFVELENCVYQHAWQDAQDGWLATIWGVNQSGGSPWMATRDVWLHGGVAETVGGLLAIIDKYGPNPGGSTHRVTFENIAGTGIEHDPETYNYDHTLANGHPIRFLTNGTPVSNITVRHLTGFMTQYFSIDSAGLTFPGLVVEDCNGAILTLFASAGTGQTAWAAEAGTGSRWRNNTFVGAGPTTSTAGTTVTGNVYLGAVAANQVTSPSTAYDVGIPLGDLVVPVGSPYKAGGATPASDGTDRGADIAALSLWYSNVVAGIGETSGGGGTVTPPTTTPALPTIVDQWRPTQRNREGLEVIPSASPLIGTSGTTITGSATTSVFIPVGRVKVSVLSLSIDAMQAALGSSTITAQVFSVKAGVSTALTTAQSIKTDGITQVGNFAMPVLTALFDGPANGSRRIDGPAGNTLRVDLVANGTVTQQPILRVVAELAVNG